MKPLTRRDAVVGLLATAAAACAGIPRYRADALPLRVPLSELNVANRLVLEHHSLPYPILLSKEGEEVIAVRMECTHQGCALSARREDLACPCHGSVFTDRGEVTKGPADADLKRYPTRREGDAIVVEL